MTWNLKIIEDWKLALDQNYIFLKCIRLSVTRPTPAKIKSIDGVSESTLNLIENYGFQVGRGAYYFSKVMHVLNDIGGGGHFFFNKIIYICLKDKTLCLFVPRPNSNFMKRTLHYSGSIYGMHAIIFKLDDSKNYRHLQKEILPCILTDICIIVFVFILRGPQ